ncbi:helix-turn-helix transcriptional regulator [Pseudomonas putida]|uniref:AraC family transcriptional regulator n=1 Tax=Pseudomonas putida TaxID=303 RepID=UPI0018AC03D4|nr:helix-turn-helix transcriptional regulator [Pseudomonas putida]MBF8653195.1 helix-turn-helix transcriptional regulator [Pseudomonas putida]MBF8657421.1 helix-turn-helix transcriptional regulator [Pseudomonas putida]
MQTLEMDYAPGDQVASHCHAHDQLIYAASGTVHVSTDSGSWVIHGGNALWVPAGVSHAIVMEGVVSMRSLLLAPHVDHCQVIVVTGLLRELILAASRMLGIREGEHVRALILGELAHARRIDTFIALPTHPRLRAWCERMLQAPAEEHALEQCAMALNMSTRNVARLFQRELGMSHGQWRARARVMLSQQCLAAGQPIINVALEHGYQSPSAFAAVFRRILGCAPSDWQDGSARPR